MTTRFEELLIALGKEMETTLSPDPNGTCELQVEEGLEVRLEPNKAGDSLLMGTLIGTVPPGKGREAFFQSALISNGLAYPRFGDLAYSQKADQLVISETLFFDGLSGAKTFEHLQGLVGACRKWREAIRTGNVPLRPVEAT